MNGAGDELGDNPEPSADQPESIDTNVDAFREKLRVAGAGEPFAIDVAFRAVTLRRVDLERGENESVADWIRGAVDEKLDYMGIVDVPRGDEPPRTRPEGYTPDDDTADEQLVDAVSKADPGEWIRATVEFPAGVLEALVTDCDEEQSVANWVRGAVLIRFAVADKEARVHPKVRVDVPPAVVQRARLWAEYRLLRDPDADYDNQLRDALLQLVEPQTEFVVDGETIASFPDCES